MIENALAFMRGARPLTAHNLPHSYDPFVGREAERREIHAWLDEPTTRLVTLLGMGGVGKSRLALEVARERLHRYPDGVWLVELADVRPGALDQAACLAVTIAAALHLPWREGANPRTYLLGHLMGKRMLLFLDSVELLAAQGLPFLHSVAIDCPGVQILATSRETPPPGLGHTLPVNGLAYPASDDDPRPWEAVELLTARRAQHSWSPLTQADGRAMRRICRAVEGLPLAIELAAGLSGEMSLPEITAALEEGLDILATPLRDVPARHRSLDAAFAASWRRLSPELQGCLVRLAGLEGSFNAATAQHKARATSAQLAALCDRSLLMHRMPDEPYRLHPVVREAVPRLGSAPALSNL